MLQFLFLKIQLSVFALAWLLALEAGSANAAALNSRAFPLNTIAGKTCKQVDSCEEAVELWCGGYRRADADHDGIPCENICHSVDQVDEIRGRIGC